MTLRTVRDKQVGTGHPGSRKPRAAGRGAAGGGEAVRPDADTTSDLPHCGPFQPPAAGAWPAGHSLQLFFTSLSHPSGNDPADA